MVIIKQIIMECSVCNWSYETDAVSDDWDEMIELEDDDCPNCKKIFLEKLVGEKSIINLNLSSLYPTKIIMGGQYEKGTNLCK